MKTHISILGRWLILVAFLTAALILICGCSREESKPVKSTETMLDERSQGAAVSLWIDHGFWPDGPGGPQPVLLIWPDGRIVWAEGEYPDQAWYEGHLPADGLGALTAWIDEQGWFDDPTLRRWNTGPDAGCHIVRIVFGHKSLLMASWHDLYEENPNLVATHDGIEPLNGRDRKNVLAGQPQDYQLFRSVWGQIRDEIHELVPDDRAPLESAPIP